MAGATALIPVISVPIPVKKVLRLRRDRRLPRCFETVFHGLETFSALFLAFFVTAGSSFEQTRLTIQDVAKTYIQVCALALSFCHPSNLHPQSHMVQKDTAANAVNQSKNTIFAAL